MKDCRCRICNNASGNTSFVAQEMMFGLHEQFAYFKCTLCGCLQIDEIPSNMSQYYPLDNYYSYNLSKYKSPVNSKLAGLIRNRVIAYYIGKINLLGCLFIHFFHYRKAYKWIMQLRGLVRSSEILDVGCGAGLLLLELNRIGFNNLTGIDPFIEKDINYPSGVQILKKSVFDLEKQFDFVMLNHSFEHMDNPSDIFQQLHKLLKPDGRLLIRIPIVDSLCWRKYGVSWYQLDAPRHFFLHTVKSMSILAKENGFEMLNIEYDSNEDQFFYSEKYIRGMTFSDKAVFRPKLVRNWKKYAKWLNSINDGDQACFNFIKNSNGK